MTDWLPRVRDELIDEFRQIPRADVERYLDEAVAHLTAVSAVDTYLPVFATRIARERAQAHLQAEGLMAKARPEVLFVCVHNAGRSQMAAVLTKTLSDGRVNVRSAGSAPTSEISANVVAVMAELGMNLSQEFPKPLTDEAVRAADVVITMGCGDACPFYPGKQYLDWELPDPAGQPIEVVREVRDDIHERVLGLLADLGVEAAPLTAGEAGRA